jgi:hypothetical protein
VSPDGWPLESNEQLGSSVALEACIAGSDILRQIYPTTSPYQVHPYVDLPNILTGKVSNIHDANEVAGYFLERMYPGRWTATDQAAVRDALASHPVDGSDISRPPLEAPAYPFEKAVGVIMSLVVCLSHSGLH